MRKLTLLALSLTLAACQPAAPSTDQEAPTPAEQPAMEEKQPADTATVAFSGTHSDIDEASSSITFKGTSTLIDHPGEFEDFNVTLTLDAAEPANLEKATMEITIEVASAKTDNSSVDAHLQREDFFDAANHPQVTFVSTNIEAGTDNMYRITGDMTAKGVTKSMTIEATITDEGISTSFNFPRKEFGVGNDSYGDKLLSEDMPVEAQFTFAK
jgi:polyisoprenoid-binding protein YceI